MAIEVAPPAVAGSAWFAINGGRPDVVAFGLAGYTVLMVLVQLRLVPVYRTAPFGPAWWSFAFSYAAAVLLGIRWLAADHVTGQRPLTWLLLAVVTVGTGVLAVRTAVHLSRGTFLPRAVIEVPQPRPGPMVETLTTTEP
jgi:tellurite resistance protein